MANKLITGIFIFFILVVLFASAKVIAKPIYLTKANTVNIVGEIDDNMTASVKEKLLKLDNFRKKRNYPIYLVIDSPGGSIYAGNKLIEVIKTVKNVHTITYFAASMASAIVQQTPGSRFILPSGIMMFHRARGGFQGQFNEGEVEQQLRLWKKIVNGMEIANAERMNMSLKKYKSLVKDEYWLESEESVYKHATDKVILVKCSQRLIDSKIETNVPSILGFLRVEKSACPAAR